jgi:hypothetical protein
MRVLYVYDLRGKGKREHNRVKRLFYYHLNRLFHMQKLWRTESCIVTDTKNERQLDVLFRRFAGNATVFKTHIRMLRRLQ